MDFDEYEYLEKTVEAVPLEDTTGKADDSRHSRDRHRERSRDRDKERERGKSRELEREKSKDYHRGRDRDYDRDRHREREYYDRERRSSRNLDGYHDRDQSRSRDHRSHTSRDSDRHYDRDREREGSRLKDRGRSYSEEEQHGHSKEEEKKEPVAEPEADPERDQRTVFAYQISLKADERDVYEFFSRAGKVRDVRLILDRNARRSKGVGYIEFYDVMSVPMAIALTGQLLLGQPVMVKPSEAEKNLVPSTSMTGGSSMGPYSGGARRLYVGNLHPSITESQLRQVFEPFGIVELVQLPLDPDTGLCKGFGFVQFVKLEDARAAQMVLNGVLELGGRVIKVLINSEQNSQDGVPPGELDDDDGGGLSLTAESRALLMQKLDRSGIASSVAGAVMKPPSVLPGFPMQPIITPILPGVGVVGAGALTGSAMEAIGTPTDCLLLKNMFDPRTEAEPDFDLDIKDEVQSECSKFGLVKHIFVDKNSTGHVYLRFYTMTAAMAAQRGLHGRWFAGKMISASYLTPQVYEGKFPESK